MHAASIVLERREPNRLGGMVSSGLCENAYSVNKSEPNLRIAAVENAIRALGALTTKIPKYENGGEHLSQELSRTMRRIYDLCQPSTQFRNVFSHGDLWSNNVMFRYDGESADPLDAILVDFQLARWAPPAFDVMTFITVSTSSEFREQYLPELLDAYYIHFEAELKYNGISAASEISRGEWLASCEHYRLAALIETNLWLPIVLLPTHLSRSVVNDSNAFREFITESREKFCLEAFETDDVFRRRLTDSIEQLVDLFVK